MTDITAHEPESWLVKDLPGLNHEIGLFAASPIPVKFANGDEVPWIGTRATVTLRGGAAGAPMLPIEIVVIDVAGKKFLCEINFFTHTATGYYKIEISQVQGAQDFTYITMEGDLNDQNHKGTTDLIIRTI